MSDTALRAGLRILFSGGAQTLPTEELQKVLTSCQVELDRRLGGLPTLAELLHAYPRTPSGTLARFRRALPATAGAAPDLGDLLRADPRDLVGLPGLGRTSLHVLRYALQFAEVTLPERWRTWVDRRPRYLRRDHEEALRARAIRSGFDDAWSSEEYDPLLGA